MKKVAIQKPQGLIRPHHPQAVTYTFCSHQQKYVFKQKSKLKLYLEESCHGFVRAPSYTLNYIIVVLLMNWKELGLLSHCTIKCTGRIRKILGVHYRHLYIGLLRSYVHQQFKIPASHQDFEEQFQLSFCAPLWCVSPEVFEIVKPPLSKEECPLRLHCHRFWNYAYCVVGRNGFMYTY